MRTFIEGALTVDHAVKEVSNAIWKAYVKGYLDDEDIELKMKGLKILVTKSLTLLPEEELLDEAMSISIRHKLPIYDSLYIALALIKEALFVSLDKEQAKVAEELGVRVKSSST